MEKKGVSLGDMYPAVLLIVLIGIVLGIGIYILSQTTVAIANTSTTVLNETITNFDDSGATVTTASECGFSTFLPVHMINASDSAQVIPSSNYTYEANTGVITYTSGIYNNTDVNLSYTYEGSGDATWCTTVDTANTGITGFASWIAVIVVVLAAAIVLGIVIRSFGGQPTGV